MSIIRGTTVTRLINASHMSLVANCVYKGSLCLAFKQEDTLDYNLLNAGRNALRTMKNGEQPWRWNRLYFGY